MSNDLCEFENIPRYGGAGYYRKGRNMNIIATAQDDYGNAVQFTIGEEYCILSEPQIVLLIGMLNKRIKCKKGFAANDIQQKRFCPAVQVVR